MKKKVYMFDEYVSSQKNGIGSFLGEFLYCMKQLDVDICVLTFNANVEEFDFVEEEGVERMLFPPFLFGDFTNHAEVVNKFFRLYIADSSRNVFFVNHSPCEKLLRMLRSSHPQSKLVFTIHDLGWTSALTGDVDKFKQLIHKKEPLEENDRNKPIVDFYNEERNMYGLADQVVCLSEDTRDVLVDTYFVSLDKIVLIPNGLRQGTDTSLEVDRDECRRKLFIHTDDKILLFSGRPTYKKGMYALLQAFGRVLEKEPDARLVIAGFDNGNNMEKLITIASAYASRVTFTGLINKSQLSEWYSAADVGIIPSYYEQCPYTGIEMMMHGLPVVASDAYGLRNMFHDGLNGKLAKIGDRENSEEFSENIATAILDILASRELQHKLRKGALSVFQSTYHARHMKENYKHLLDSL